jgi:hypothetical protein
MEHDGVGRDEQDGEGEGPMGNARIAPLRKATARLATTRGSGLSEWLRGDREKGLAQRTDSA